MYARMCLKSPVTARMRNSTCFEDLLILPSITCIFSCDETFNGGHFAGIVVAFCHDVRKNFFLEGWIAIQGLARIVLFPNPQTEQQKAASSQGVMEFWQRRPKISAPDHIFDATNRSRTLYLPIGSPCRQPLCQPAGTGLGHLTPH